MAYKTGNKVQIPILISEATLQQIEDSKGQLTRTKFLSLTIEELFSMKT